MDIVGRLGVAVGCLIAACIAALLALALAPFAVVGTALLALARSLRCALRAMATRPPGLARTAAAADLPAVR